MTAIPAVSPGRIRKPQPKMRGRLLGSVVTAVALLLPGAGMAEAPVARDPDSAAVLALSPRLRAALVAEMAGLKNGIAELSVALASGEWGQAAARAERIRDSYLLKQKLSRAELKELEHSLPADFLAMDERFHRHAASLVQAAHRRDHELAVVYFGKMLEGCGNCHARYATHTFRGFVPARAPSHAH